MNVTTPPMHKISEAYGVSRQWIHELRKQHGFQPADFLTPEQIFQTLLEKGNASPMRTRLASPITRQSIQSKLS